jgi:beta-lactamase class C
MKIKNTIPYTIAIIIVFAFIFYSPSNSHIHVNDSDPIIKKRSSLGLQDSHDPHVEHSLNPYVRQLLDEYAAFIQTEIITNQAPGAAVAIIRDTSIIYLKGFGLRDVGTKDSIDVHSLFRIGSVSKGFASVLTGILVDENRLLWDDPVIKYLPDFKLKTEQQTQGLTLRHLLSHTTGLPYHAFTDRVDVGANFDTLVYHLRDLPLFGKPGQRYSYQNVGFSLIGEVIRSATGKTYAENLKEKIFTPLHMQDASVSFEAITQNKNVARAHRHYKGWKPMAISNTYYNVAPAGGINASISDMACWLRSITGGSPQLLKPETRDEVFRPEVSATSRNRNFWRWKPVRSSYYALGWRVLNFSDDTLVYHGGFVNGYRCEVAINRKDKTAICVMVNSSGPLPDLSIPKFFEMYSRRQDAIDTWERTDLKSSARK